MKRRLRKKLHRGLLWEVGADLSVHQIWREKLFAGELGHEFLVDSRSTIDLTYNWVSLLRRYGLEYVAARVGPDGVDPWISQNGRVAVFAFWPKEFPRLRYFTGNPYPGSPEVYGVQRAW